MGPYGTIQDHIGPYVTIRTIVEHKRPYGNIQYPMVPYRTIAGYFKLMVLFQTS